MGQFSSYKPMLCGQSLFYIFVTPQKNVCLNTQPTTNDQNNQVNSKVNEISFQNPKKMSSALFWDTGDVSAEDLLLTDLRSAQMNFNIEANRTKFILTEANCLDMKLQIHSGDIKYFTSKLQIKLSTLWNHAADVPITFIKLRFPQGYESEGFLKWLNEV